MLYALDIETTGLDRFKDRIICIGVYSPERSYSFTSLNVFATWLKENPNAQFIMHRGSFDVNFLRHGNVDISSRWLFDTRSVASILTPRPRLAEGQRHELGLENLAIVYLNKPSYKLDRTNMASYAVEDVIKYCLEDCETTYHLFEKLVQLIPEKDWSFVDSWLMPATKFCADLEWNGVHVDVEGLKAFQSLKTKQRDRILKFLNSAAERAIKTYHDQQVIEVTNHYKEMYEKAVTKAKDKEKCARRYQGLASAALSKIEAFNWNSSEQLKWLFRDYYGLDIRNEREDKETTNEAMLKELAPKNRVAKILLLYRELEKLVSTCIPALVENSEESIVHASYNVGGTRTGRLSSSGPNLQQIPRGRIRSFITSSNNNSLVTIDYAQIEVRILAHLAKETELINAFKEKIDCYSLIAQKLLKIDCPVREIKARYKKERDVSKTAGLSILYGTGARKLQEVLAKELGLHRSVTDCKQFIDEYRNSFPAIKNYKQRLERELANGKKSHNLLGRPFSIDSNDDIYMKSMNTAVQGSASDLVIWSQTNLVIPELKKLGVAYKHRMVIHDEVVIELPKDEADLLVTEVIAPLMTTGVERALDLTTPLAIEYTISRQWEKP